jgi:CBS domain containing-hemolysin-like protein
MPLIVELLLAAMLFLLALRMSFFFSGSETGFYRLSRLRISLDARAGDRAARRLIRFVRSPSRFVATTLVGNNIANYLVTFSIGMATILLVPKSAGAAELVATVLITPVIFVLGELLPKGLYLRSPMHFLRREAWLFQLIYFLLLPVSYPLMLIARLFERFGETDETRARAVLGRTRLTQAVSEGHKQGLLTELQNRLVHQLLTLASEPARQIAAPPDMVYGCPDTATREELLKTGRDFGVPLVALRQADEPTGWYGYVRVIDLAVTMRPLGQLVRTMPRIPARANKLEALLTLRSRGEDLGVLVNEQNHVVGVLAENGLVGQLFRTHPTGPAGM